MSSTVHTELNRFSRNSPMTLSKAGIAFLVAGIRLSQAEIIIASQPSWPHIVLAAGLRLLAAVEGVKSVVHAESTCLHFVVAAIQATLHEIVKMGADDFSHTGPWNALCSHIATIKTDLECMAQRGGMGDWLTLGELLPRGFDQGGVTAISPRTWIWDEEDKVEAFLKTLSLDKNLIFPKVLEISSDYRWISEMGTESQSWKRIELGIKQLNEGDHQDSTSGIPDLTWANRGRDEWLHRKYCEGVPIKLILAELRTTKWGHLKTPPGVLKAVRAYAARMGLPKIPRRRAGRKPG